MSLISLVTCAFFCVVLRHTVYCGFWNSVGFLCLVVLDCRLFRMTNPQNVVVVAPALDGSSCRPLVCLHAERMIQCARVAVLSSWHFAPKFFVSKAFLVDFLLDQG